MTRARVTIACILARTARLALVLLVISACGARTATAQPRSSGPVANEPPVPDKLPGDTRTPTEYVDLVSSAGDRHRQADDSIRALNRTARDHYAHTLQWISGQLDPVIVVQFDGVGGTFTLRTGGRSVTAQPVPSSYELAKSVAHSPLGIFVIIAPYMQTPESTLWHADLRAFAGRVRAALERLNDSALPADARQHARAVLRESLAFIDGALTAKAFTEEAYQAYARRIIPAVRALRYFATDTQVRAVVAHLEKWRAELGEARWKQLAAVVIAPYTIGSETPNLQCLRYVMDPERVADRLIVVGGDYGKDVDRAVSVLGRLFMDRYAARLVFDSQSDEGRKDIRALSSKRDFMADTTGAILRKLAAERTK